MKVAVINYSGSVRKTLISSYLLAPRLTGAKFYAVETINQSASEGANKQVISSQADSLIKISRIWADFFPANTSNQPI